MAEVPGTGWCLLYSVIASAPGLVRERLISGEFLHEDDPVAVWLLQPDRVREDSEALARLHQPGRDLAPDALLQRAAEMLGQLTLGYLEANRAALPEYVQRVRAHFRGLIRVPDEDLIAALENLGVTYVASAAYVPAWTLRSMYLDVRASELAETGADWDAGRARAETEVPLNADGSLADQAPSPQAMLDYLAERGVRFGLDALDPAALRGYLSDSYTLRAGPLDDVEFAAVREAVQSWGRAWASAGGEAFAPLLACALGVWIRVVRYRGPGPGTSEMAERTVVATLGEEGNPAVDLYYIGTNHYNGSAPASPEFAAPVWEQAWDLLLGHLPLGWGEGGGQADGLDEAVGDVVALLRDGDLEGAAALARALGESLEPEPEPEAEPGLEALQAMPVTAPGPLTPAADGRRTADERLDALARWIAGEQAAPGQKFTGPAVEFAADLDCVTRAAAAFKALHGRSGNRAVDDHDLADVSLTGLLRALDATPVPVGDREAIHDALASAPGAAALVIRRSARDRAHVYWLVADGRGDKVVLRWVDAGTEFVDSVSLAGPSRPGPPDEAGGDASGWRAEALYDPFTRVALLDPTGHQVTADDLLGSQTAVPGLTAARSRPCWTRLPARASLARFPAGPGREAPSPRSSRSGGWSGSATTSGTGSPPR